MNLQRICEQSTALIREVGDFIAQSSPGKVETKATHDYVTEIDKSSEQKLVKGLGEILPQAGFIAEEGTSTQRGSVFNWVIDPLDGTTNFIHSVPPFSISVALMENREIVLGIVYEINLRECFYTWKGAKAYLNGTEITVSQTAAVKTALIATGFPFRDYAKVDQFIDSLKFFMQNSRGIRRHGSAAVDLAYVAAGRFDAFYEYALQPWDVAAGVILVRQAGGKICDFDGQDNFLYGKEIVAANPLLFSEFQSQIEQLMKR